MTGLDDAALLAVVAIGSALGASALPRASWPRRSPAAAILLWQALGLASGLAAVGTLIGLALPASDGGLVRSVLHAAALLRNGDVVLVNVSYDPTRELYEEINRAFADHYRSTSGMGRSRRWEVRMVAWGGGVPPSSLLLPGEQVADPRELADRG